MPSSSQSVAIQIETSVESIVYRTVEVLSVITVVAEIALLFTSAIARYAFNYPLIWSDELASTLLIWMTMLGAVVAFRRGEHMRLTIVLLRLPPAWRVRITIFATCLTLVFIAGTMPSIIDYVRQEDELLSPMLALPYSVSLSAIPVGLALIFIIGLLSLLREHGWRPVLVSVGVILACTAVMWVGTPLFQAAGNYSLIFFFVVLLIFIIFTGAPIAFAFGIATFAHLAIDTDVPLTVIANRIGEGMSDSILSAIPLFIFLGALMVMTGLARTLVEFLLALVGHLRGGVSYVLIGGMYLVSGISGAKAADMAAVAPVLLPEMERRGSDRGELVALMAATGAMSETIPPSIVLIVTGAVTGVSIRALFTAGFVPAALCALCLILVVIMRSWKEKPIASGRPGGRVIAKAFVAAIPALLLPILIRTLVVGGVTTATEVSAFAIAYALVLGLIYRRLDWRELYRAALDAASLSGAIIIILGFVTAVAWALTQSGVSFELESYFLSIPGGSTGFMLATIVILMVLGSILEGVPAVVLVGPILFPIAQELGISATHYAIVAILAMGIGLFTPPFGVGFYYSAAIGGASPDQVMRKIWLYLAFVLIGTLIVAFVPWFSTGFL